MRPLGAGQIRMLRALAAAAPPHAIRACDLAILLDVCRARVAQLCESLARRGLVRVDRLGRSVTIVHLTLAGLRVESMCPTIATPPTDARTLESL